MSGLFNPSGWHTPPNGGVGMLNTQTFRRDAANRPQFLETVLRRYPGGSVQLSAIIDSMKKSDCISTDVGWKIENVRFPTLTLLEELAPASQRQVSTLKVDSTRYLLPNMLFVAMPYGEMMMITSITGDHTCTAIRGMGTVPAWGASAGAQLQFAGNAFEEGSLRPLGTFTESERMWTQTQIFRDAWATTETEHVVATANGYNVTATNKQDAMYNHGVAHEMAILFGQQSNTVYKGQPMRTFSGLLEFVRYNAPQNIISVAGKMNYDELCAVFDAFGDVQIGKNPSDMRIIYGDKTFVTAIHQIGMRYGSLLRMTDNNQDSFGQRFRSFITPRLRFDVYEHPLFQVMNMPRGMAFVVDPTTLELRYLRRTSHHYFNADASGKINEMTVDGGVDARGGDFITEMTFLCHNPAANGVIYGLTGGKGNDFNH